MSQVRDILERKGTQVWTIGKEATVLQAALLMNEHKIGALVVTESGRIVGMFTERDVLRRIVAEQRNPSNTAIADVMTGEVLCCTPQTLLEEARTVMMQRRIRHLPVAMDDGELLGMISIGDLNAYHQASQDQTIFMMTEYLYGRV